MLPVAQLVYMTAALLLLLQHIPVQLYVYTLSWAA